MAIGFRVHEGPLEGKVFKISAGMSLGRKNADLNLEDKKASSLHATVVENAGQLHIMDQNSRNGIYFNDQRVQSMPLNVGNVVVVGKTTLEVIDLSSTDSDEFADPLETWRQALVNLNEKIIASGDFEEKDVVPVVPAVKLRFTHGRQMKSKYVIGYGPREVGVKCTEFPIYEPGMPDVCFSITDDGGPYFKTEWPDRVKLNQRVISEGLLEKGDKIYMGETIIEVSFIEAK